MLRFSLLTLLGVVLVAAVGSAALANPTDTWRQVAFTITVVVLLFFTLLAAVTRSRRRPFALGCGIVGWSYFVLTFTSHFGDVKSFLLTEWVVEWSCEALHYDSLDGVRSKRLPSPRVSIPKPLLH